MANLDWSQCPAVESITGKVSGAWVFRNTRSPVATVIENLEDLSVDEVMEQFDVTREQIRAVLDFVAQSLQPPIPPQATTPADAHSHSLCPRKPRGLARKLNLHIVTTAREMGWEQLSNGDLFQAAEEAAF